RPHAPARAELLAAVGPPAAADAAGRRTVRLRSCLQSDRGCPGVAQITKRVGWAKTRPGRSDRCTDLSPRRAHARPEHTNAWATARNLRAHLRAHATRRCPPYATASRLQCASALGDHHFEILAVHHERAAVVAIERASEREQVLGKRILSRRV